jgi:hypothetical protein|tara:strand:- start:5886 stop:6800 length:915 start_codon:yes stop_codon:yes gene_type:complete
MKLRIILQSEIGNDKRYLDFKLYDTPIAKKVMESLEIARAEPNSNVLYRIDQTFNQDNNSASVLAEEMNSVINKVNQLGLCSIPLTCLLDLNLEPHLQPERLNQLHLIFQQFTEEHGKGSETQELLERVNILVHTLETVPTDMDKVLIVAKQEYYRPHILEGIDLTITDEDFDSKLPWGMWGFLELDYNTVGKDLAACFGTSDVVLATEHADELRQQTTYAPAFAMNFDQGPQFKNTEEQDYWKMEEYYAWCNEHNVPLPFTAPEYRVGRIRLGEVAEDFTMEEMHKLVIEFPNIVELLPLNDK